MENRKPNFLRYLKRVNIMCKPPVDVFRGTNTERGNQRELGNTLAWQPHWPLSWRRSHGPEDGQKEQINHKMEVPSHLFLKKQRHRLCVCHVCLSVVARIIKPEREQGLITLTQRFHLHWPKSSFEANWNFKTTDPTHQAPAWTHMVSTLQSAWDSGSIMFPGAVNQHWLPVATSTDTVSFQGGIKYISL